MSDTALAEALKDRLRELARERPSLDVAKFQFVGLDEIRRAYGDRWPGQKERIRNLAYDYLKQRIAPKDVIVRGGDGFVLLFGESSGREAEVEALGLSHGLNDHFLGELREPAPRVDVSNVVVPVNDLVKTLGDVDFVPGESAPAVAHTLADKDWRYQPVWDVKREALTMYSLFPILSATSERLPGYRFESMPGRPPKLDEVDEAAIHICEQAIRKLFSEGKRAMVGSMVHVSSLMNGASRARLMAALSQCDHNLLRYKAFKIAGVAPGFPRMYLDEIFGAVKLRCPNLVLGLSWDEPNLQSLVSLPITAVSIMLTPSVCGPHPSVAQSTLLSSLRRAADAARAAKKSFKVEGAFTPDLAIRLSAIGVDSISSPLIWPPTMAPEGVSAWSADKLAVR
jgi:hypothetical protein